MRQREAPVVSVVIPAFNAARFIRRTIDSVLAQTYQDYEVIVVDDGSSDNMAEVVRGYGAKVRYIYQKNAGDGPARNTGIKAAKGEWIAFLDHDDEWLPEKLRLQMALLDRNPGLRWCGTNRYQSDGKRRVVVGSVDLIRKALGGNDYFENYFTAVVEGVCPVITSTMVIHRQVFDEVGTFNSCWLRGADLDMWWRITYHAPRIGYLPEPLVIVHLDAPNVVSARLRCREKRGEDVRVLVARHLELAKAHDMLEEFKPVAKRFLRLQLITTLYHGFQAESRLIVSEYKDFFPWYWRVATYILTTFPKLTSAMAKALAYARYKLGLEREVSRRWISSDQFTDDIGE